MKLPCSRNSPMLKIAMKTPSNPASAVKRNRWALPFLFLIGFMPGCGSKEEARKAAAEAPTPAELIDSKAVVHGAKIESVEVANPLNAEWVAKGKAAYEMKCLACHKLDETRVVGPGWSGVTKRRTPVWIMNMITNTEMMLETDEDAQKLLEMCLVRMPNQNMTEQEAREVLEFMRQNDGEK